jgi:hypothetical protein
MGIREQINRKQWLGMGGTAALILMVLIFILWQVSNSRRTSAALTRAFYSDDDGTSWFLDDRMKIVPFDHNGKPAVRVEVFRCKGGKPFAGYLERYSDAVIAKMTALNPENPGAAALFFHAPMEVKRPGDPEWFSMRGGDPSSMKQFTSITTPACPDGGPEDLTLVSPADAGNGAD